MIVKVKAKIPELNRKAAELRERLNDGQFLKIAISTVIALEEVSKNQVTLDYLS